MTIAIFASGRGTNAENIINYFSTHNHKFIIITNDVDAEVVERANRLNVSCVVIRYKDKLSDILNLLEIDFIILAGYLKLIPLDVVRLYENKIINIHPSLLPKYGGKGMWGINVHKAVIQGQETESGCTIHYVSEEYDKGAIIEQHKCDVLLCDTPETLFKKVHELEMSFYPKCIERLISLL